MTFLNSKSGRIFKETSFQILLHVTVFIFYSFDARNPKIETYKYVFFLNYTLGSFIINYLLLPRFYFRKKYLYFILSVLVVIAGVIAVEELVIEKIYFPDSRGRGFPGVFYSLMDVLPVVIIISGFKFAHDALIKQYELDKLKTYIKDSELQFLQSQINPHFLFNNLNNLYSYAIENSPKTPTIILELSSVLRYMLYECKASSVALSKEIEQLENFTKLSQLQIEDRGSVTFNAQKPTKKYQIAPLVLIVFLENAFKHSTASQSSGIKVEVDISVTDKGWLEFTCVNSYRPNDNTDSHTNGIGLENVKKRLELLYPKSHKLEITQGDEEYSVHLTIRLNQDES